MTMKTRSGFVVLLALAASILVSAACGDDDDATPATTAAAGATTAAANTGGDVKVTVSDNKFEPATATLKVNNEVIWEWKGNNPHTVVGTFQGEKVESPRLTGSGSFTFSFTKAGTFTYQCGIHGAGMGGTIIVQ
jgi:plastocyanin